MPPGPITTGAAPARRAAALPADQRRAAIIRATLPLLVEHGEMVTTRRIAEAAGIAEGTIFRVFADKDELLSAVLDEALDLGPVEEAFAAIDPDLPFPAQLEAAVDTVQRRIVDVWGLVSNLGPRLREQAARPLSDSAALTELFARHRDELRIEPADAARLLRALTLSLTHPMLHGTAMSPDGIVDVLLHGIGGDR